MLLMFAFVLDIFLSPSIVIGVLQGMVVWAHICHPLVCRASVQAPLAFRVDIGKSGVLIGLSALMCYLVFSSHSFCYPFFVLYILSFDYYV